MKILVPISKVPDTTSKITFADGDTKFAEEGIQWIVNPYDEWYALVRALELVEAGGGTVTVINVGGATSDPVIRKALALGAHEAVRIDTEASESYVVAKEIAAYAADKGFDMVLLGKETISYNGSEVGGMLAEFMNVPYISLASSLEVNGDSATMDRTIEGGVEVSTKLLENRWDYIFFTGSVSVGKIVAKAAAEYLTPVTLELGGKSPCIIDKTANIKLAAKRIVWGKFINAGQTCIAPDYLLIHTSKKEEFIKHFKDELINAYGENPEKSADFPRIVNEKNFNRLALMLKNEEFFVGGKTNKEDNYISPTLINEPSLNNKVMQSEIFGPILPLISFESEEEIEEILSKFNKPLAFYIFSNDKNISKKMIEKHSFGGGTINDTTVHFINHRLPFGGVGESGIGGYHGKKSFDTFTHNKGVVTRGNWLDLPIRYAPYTDKLKKLRTLLKWI